MVVAGLALGGATVALSMATLAEQASATVGAESGTLAWNVPWTPHVAGPEAAQAAVMRRLAGVLRGAGVAGIAVAALVLGTLYATRADLRRGEWTIRRALGASRRQLLVGGALEGATVATGALAVAVLGAATASAVAIRAWPDTGWSSLIFQPAPAVLALAVVAFIVLLSVAPFLGAGRASNLAVPPVATRGIVVPAIQLGTTLAILLAGARLARSHAGMRPDTASPVAPNGLVYEISLPDAGSPDEREAFLAPVLETLERSPAIAAASLTSRGMLVGLGVTDLAITDCGACSQGGLPAPYHPVSATYHLVSADTFDAVGISLLRGRGVAADDGPTVEPVAIVNRALAQHHFERQGALGRRIRVGRSPGRWHRVVGVVDDSGSRVLRRPEPVFAVYLSALQHPAAELDLMVMPTANPMAAERSVVETLGATLASPVPVRLDVLRRAIARPVRRLAMGVGAVGILVLVLASYGVAVVAALSARRRRNEYALRQAVGARARDVRRLAFTDIGRSVVLGLAIGWWLDLFVSGIVASAVGGGAAIGLPVGLGLASLLAASALLSALVPAWRAAALAPAGAVGVAE
jgi:hypothetical protein